MELDVVADTFNPNPLEAELKTNLNSEALSQSPPPSPPKKRKWRMGAARGWELGFDGVRVSAEEEEKSWRWVVLMTVQPRD